MHCLASINELILIVITVDQYIAIVFTNQNESSNLTISFQTSVSVQTDPVLVLPVPPIKEDKALQVPQDYEDMVRAVASDHSYMLQHSIAEVSLSSEADEPSSLALQMDTAPSHGSGQLITSTPIKLAQDVASRHSRHSKPSCSGVAPLHLSDSDAEQDAEPSFVEEDALDVTYLPEADSFNSMDESGDPAELEDKEGPVSAKKYIVFLDNLLELVRLLRCQCSNPPSPVDNIEQYEVGSNVSITAYCISGHIVAKWDAQPRQGKMPLGNLLLSAAILCSGQTYGKVAHMCNLINVRIPSKTTYNVYQREMIIPEINYAWECENRAAIHEVIERGGEVQVAGDGRCDSPGFCAKYCLYSHMDLATNKILSLQLVQVSETGSSARMEVVGYERGMEFLLARGVQVSLCATDRHVSVRKLHSTQYSPQGILHEFDVYHLAGHVRRKIKDMAKKPRLRRLQPWIRSMVNHLWWCASTCDGDPDLLVEKWLSITNHVCNIHHHPDNATYQDCAHGPLEDTLQRRTKWLDVDSHKHDALVNVVHNKRFLKDIRQLANFCHTGKCSVSYCKTSNISRTFLGNKIVDNSDVVGVLPVGAAPTTSSFST